MHAYDPLDAPNPDEWLAVGKLERIDAIEAYHTQGAVELPDARTHAVFHAIIENQLALRLAPVCDALARLLRDGLDRPEAIHAIASVLAEHMFDLHRGRITDQPNKRYFKHCPMGFERSNRPAAANRAEETQWCLRCGKVESGAAEDR